jgi:hypothetical protein
MAAFCPCCGAKISLKAEPCPACGNPRHGMLRATSQFPLETQVAAEQDVRIDSEAEVLQGSSQQRTAV